MSVEKELFGRFKHNIKPAKSQKYINWLKKQPQSEGMEPHHLIGSQGSLKLTDYLIVMVTRKQHELAEKFKIRYFVGNLHIAVNNLISYVQHLERV